MAIDMIYVPGIWYDFALASDWCDYKREDCWRYVILARVQNYNDDFDYRLIWKNLKETVYPWYDVSGDNCYPTGKFDEFMIIPE